MRRWLPMMAFMAIVTLCGCAGIVDSVPDLMRTAPWWESTQTGNLGSRARELEAQGELTMALDHWRLIHRISNGQVEAVREIERLESKIAKAVQSHYENGLTKLRMKRPASSRNHFLAALRLDPTFQPALKQIRVRFSTFPLTVRQSAPGENLTTVAKNVFGNQEKAFVVAWFNNLPEDGELAGGSLLILPKMENKPVKQKQVLKKKPLNRLAEANTLVMKNDFDGALALARQANPENPDVQALIHFIHLKKATAQIESGLPEDARQSLSMVPDGFAGKDAALKALKDAMQKQHANRVLEEARAYFDQGAYQQSMELVEKLLEDAPDRVDAYDLVAEARYRVALDHVHHKRFLEAREVLAKTDNGHEAGMALKEVVRTRLLELAQVHYRNGVKDFINEDLKSAIAEWEMALACNPGHEKASENIENARRLLDKIETLP